MTNVHPTNGLKSHASLPEEPASSGDSSRRVVLSVPFICLFGTFIILNPSWSPPSHTQKLSYIPAQAQHWTQSSLPCITVSLCVCCCSYILFYLFFKHIGRCMCVCVCVSDWETLRSREREIYTKPFSGTPESQTSHLLHSTCCCGFLFNILESCEKFFTDDFLFEDHHPVQYTCLLCAVILQFHLEYQSILFTLMQIHF